MADLVKISKIKTSAGEHEIDAKYWGGKTIDVLNDLNNMEEITYSDLNNLKTGSKLIKGKQYRITDYVTTTTQENTQSAGHSFDIIVTADSNNTFNEVARACLHSGDTYFSGVNMDAWEIKYSFDNDTNRFAWASSSGKGVIYYMKDEWNNECWYDFKNIQFVRYKLNPPTVGGYDNEWQNKLSENVNGMFEKNILSYIWHGSNSGDYYWDDDLCEVFSTATEETKAFYTFSNVINDEITDKSLTRVCFSNVIKCYKLVSLKLNNNIFFSNNIYDVCDSNSFGNNCFSNSFGDGCYSNSFDDSCCFNSFGDLCSNNNFGTHSGSNSFSNNCSSNSFGNGCYSNSFGNSCHFNSFGNSCSNNTFGDGCDSNTFGNSCISNTFTDSCESNSFGNFCESNSFGNNCHSNSFGNACQHNSFGNTCYSNSFGNACQHNSFGNTCYSNSFIDECCYNIFIGSCVYNSFGNACNSNSLGEFCQRNSFGNGCYSNSFGNACYDNSFGNACGYNFFGDSCDSNSFGNSCSNNSFGNSCYYNTIGNDCNHNTFGNECNSNTFGNGCSYNGFYVGASYTNQGNSGYIVNSEKLNYVRNITISEGCAHLLVYTTITTNSSNYVQNITITKGIKYTTFDGRIYPLTILIPDVNNEYEIKVAKNTSGELKIYCEADLIA